MMPLTQVISLSALIWFTVPCISADAATLRVPAQHATIESAILASVRGDTVMVAAGTYGGRLVLKPGIVVRSEGNDAKGKRGLKRAEATILDASGGGGPGVEMAMEATLDGFTITGAGKYDDTLWQHHFDTQGNEQAHEHIGQPGVPGISVTSDCVVLHNIVHHNGSTGIAITGAAKKAVSPRIAGNVCYRNMGGGIGSMNGSTALIEQNTCFENFHAGIGCDGSSPLVKNNTCHGNIRSGIGISEGSSPKVTGNLCFKNRRAGIGIRTGNHTRPLVEGNECRENEMAGIGVEEGARPDIQRNHLINNKLVAIGITGGSRAVITDNEIARDGGAPPMIAVLDKSHALITGNTIRGGGVTAVLIKGTAQVKDNHFIGGKDKGNAVWAHAGAEIEMSGNKIQGWARPLLADKAAKVTVNDSPPSAVSKP